MALARSVLLASLALFTAAGCRGPEAALLLEASSPATADPLVFHGNCFAGWQVAAEVDVRERGGVEVLLDAVTYRIDDQGTGLEVVATRLEGDGLDEHAGGRRIGPRSARRIRLFGLSATRPQGPVRLRGQASGHDLEGERVTAGLDIVLPLRVASRPPPDPGACGPGSPTGSD